MSKFLILGGLGFIGRNLVRYLIDSKVASKIRVADKTVADTANLSDLFRGYINHPIVERVQANLSNVAHVTRAFKDEQFDYIINLAAETKYGQPDTVYKQHIVDVAVNVGKEAEKQISCQRFIHVSTAQVYDADKKPSKEDSKIKPWTKIAQFHKQAEDELKQLNLPIIIIRPSAVYGPCDYSGLTPRLVCGAVYKNLNEKMQFMWTGELKFNTVHVRDVCASLWYLCNNGNIGEIYNIADKNDTDQQKIADLIAQLFHIQTGFIGTIQSTAARLNMKGVVEDINEKHAEPWAKMLATANMTSSTLSPYIDQELLYNNPLSIDGSKIEKLGFRYEYPLMELRLLKEVVDGFIQQGVFPLPEGYARPPPIPPPTFS